MSNKNVFTDIEVIEEVEQENFNALVNGKSINIGAGASSFKGDSSGIWLGANKFDNAPFRVDMQGNAWVNNLVLSGGEIKFGKVSFSDSAHAGFYLSSAGIYFGSVSDAAKLKFTVASGLFEIIGKISGSEISGSVITGSTLQTGTVGPNVNIKSDQIELRNGTSVTGTITGNSGAGYSQIFVNEVRAAIITRNSGDITIDAPSVLYLDGGGYIECGSNRVTCGELNCSTLKVNGYYFRRVGFTFENGGSSYYIEVLAVDDPA